MSREILEQVVARAIGDAAFRQLLRTNPGAALREFRLTKEERNALTSGDPTKLVALGIDQRMSRMVLLQTDQPHVVSAHGFDSDLPAASGTVRLDPAAEGGGATDVVETTSAGGGRTEVIDVSTHLGRTEQMIDTQGAGVGGATSTVAGPGIPKFEQLIPSDTSPAVTVSPTDWPGDSLHADAMGPAGPVLAGADAARFGSDALDADAMGRVSDLSTPGQTEARIGEPVGGAEGGATATAGGFQGPKFEQLIPSDTSTGEAVTTEQSWPGDSLHADAMGAAGPVLAGQDAARFGSDALPADAMDRSAVLSDQDVYEARGESATFGSPTVTSGDADTDLDMTMIDRGAIDAASTTVSGESSGVDMLLIDAGTPSGASPTVTTDIDHAGDSASDAVVPLEPGAPGATVDTDTSGIDSGAVTPPPDLGGGGDIEP